MVLGQGMKLSDGESNGIGLLGAFGGWEGFGANDGTRGSGQGLRTSLA